MYESVKNMDKLALGCIFSDQIFNVFVAQITYSLVAVELKALNFAYLDIVFKLCCISACYYNVPMIWLQ